MTLLDRTQAIDLYAEITKKTPGQKQSAQDIDAFSKKIIGEVWDTTTDVERSNLMANLFMAYSDVLSQ
jgi:hypothetical protein